MKSVCVLILNYNSYEDTINYVSVLRRQKKVSLRILVVDNCSPNGSFEKLTREFAGAEDVTVIQSERNGGYAYGNNFGLRHIRDWAIDYVLISNNDIAIDNDELVFSLVTVYPQLATPAFISGVAYTDGVPARYPAWRMPTLHDDIAGSLRFLSKLLKDRTGYTLRPDATSQPVDCLPGCFFMGSKEVFFRIGLMDDKTFLYMEEVILAHKAKAAGLQNYLIAGVNYEHMGSKTISSLLSQQTMRAHLIRSRVYYHEQYLHTGVVGIAILKLLFHAWKLENFLYRFIQSRTRG